MIRRSNEGKKRGFFQDSSRDVELLLKMIGLQAELAYANHHTRVTNLWSGVTTEGKRATS